MRLLILAILLLPVAVFAQCTSNCGIDTLPPSGNVPTSIVGTPDALDQSVATFTWNTAIASDSCVTLQDSLNNSWRWWCEPTHSLVTSHSVTITGTVPATTAAPTKYYVSSCTHAHDGTFTSGGVTQQAHQFCPLASPDWSSSGGPSRNPSPVTLTTHAAQSGTLQAWSFTLSAPTHVYQGSAVFATIWPSIGRGLVTSSGFNNVNTSLVLTGVSYTDTASIVHNCNSGIGGVYPSTGGSQSAATVTSCNGTSVSGGGIPANDFSIIPVNSGGIFQPTFTNANYMALSYNAALGGSGNGGYFVPQWNGGSSVIYIAAGSSLPAGNYNLNFFLTPTTSSGPIAGQSKSVSLPITVEAVSPLANVPPGSFSVPFENQYLAMAAWWGTWACTNPLSLTFDGRGPWAQYFNSGVTANTAFPPNSTSDFFNYDPPRWINGLSDKLFAVAHNDWAASTTYPIGTIITHSGQSYILTGCNGASNATLSCQSGTTTPSFTGAPSGSTPNYTTDSGGSGGPLQWAAIGTPSYWMGCAEPLADYYKFNVLWAQGQQDSEPNQWATGIAMTTMRTGDAIPGTYTGYSYTESGAPFGGIGASYIHNQGNEQCNGLTETGSATSLVGAGRMANCYMDSTMSTFIPLTNGVNVTGGRALGLTLADMVADWMLSNNASWTTSTTIPQIPGIRMLRKVDAAISFLDQFENITPEHYPSSPIAGGLVTYMPSQVARALLAYYQGTVWYSNSANYFQTPVVTDERIPLVLRRVADYMWVNYYDRIFDKNQLVADACYNNFPTICQNTRRLHSYTFPYNLFEPADAQSPAEFFNESSSNSEWAAIYAWLFARCSTCTIPSNGRNTATTYGDAAQIMIAHAFDGRNITVSSPPSKGAVMNSWAVDDFYDGGRGTGTGSGFATLVGGGKHIGQDMSDIISEGIKWLDGQYTSTDGSLVPVDNPCWVTANQTGFDKHCSVASPFPETAIPAPFMGQLNGVGPTRNIVTEPAVCLPSGNGATSFCRQPFTVGGFAFNAAGANGTSATITFATPKKTDPAHPCTLSYGTSPSSASTTISETFTSTLLTQTQLPLWSHSITTGTLTPNTLYHMNVQCQDFVPNVWRSVYQFGDVGPLGATTVNCWLCTFEQQWSFNSGVVPPQAFTMPLKGTQTLQGSSWQ